MKEFKFVPKNEVFEGFVTVRVPKYMDRLKLLKECNFSFGANGEVNAGSGQFESIEKMVSVVEKHVSAVEIVVKSTQEAIKSLDDLSYTAEGSELINELANLILGGFKLGKI